MVILSKDINPDEGDMNPDSTLKNCAHPLILDKRAEEGRYTNTQNDYEVKRQKMIDNTKIVYKKPIVAILFSAIMVLSIFSGVVLADNTDRSNEIPDDYVLFSGVVNYEYTATSGTMVGASVSPKFLTLPSNDSEVKIQQGWFYDGGGTHEAIDYIKGTVDQSSTWVAFDVVAVANGQAMYVPMTSPSGSESWGNYVLTRHTVNADIYYTVNAHLESSSLPPDSWVNIKRGEKIGVAGKTGKANNVIHLHFEFSKKGYGKGYRIDPYDIYSTKKDYPPNASCGPNRYWTTDPPSTADDVSNGKVKGIDVSHWQGDIDWPKVYDSGYRFVFVKASQGVDFKDSKIETNMKNGHNAGLLMGAYHYATPYTDGKNDAADEARHFASVAGEYFKEGYLRPVLDLEEGKDLGKEKLSNWVHEWMNTVKDETGIEPILYVNSNYANNHLDSSVAKYDLWIAHWTYDPNASPNIGIWASWGFWQYSDKGSVPGISGNVDLDIFNGDMSRLYTFIIPTKLSLDLIFTIDTTGSMWDDIAYVKASASAIVDEIFSDIPTARIAVVDYRDFSVSPYGGAGDYPFNDVLSFSTDKPSIVAAIQGLTLGWGADWRESVYSGLMHSIDSTSLGGWRGSDQAAKVIILMGDAPPHDPEPFTGYTLSSVVTAAYNADPVIIYPIQIGGTVEKFEELADQTGGVAFTAANAEEVVDAILEAIGEIKTKPVAVANGPYSGYVGSPITFDGTGSYDLDGTIVSYEWDLDDDGEFDDATGPTPSMTWAVPYSGTISLRVTDNDETTDTDSTTLTVDESGDTEQPIIEFMALDAYTTIHDATIHVTVGATDNVGVTSVTADSVALVETGSIWEGDITAPSTTGDYTLTIRAEDDAGNFNETTVEYSVVKPHGSIGIGVDPRLTSVITGSVVIINIKLVSVENFDDVAYVYLTTDGLPPIYQANLTWFNWTSQYVKVPAGAVVNVPLEVNIPIGESGYKVFYAKLESTKWTPTAMDTGILYIT